MSDTIEIREGTVSTIQMQLLSEGSGINLLSAYSVEIRMLDAKNRAYRFSSLDAVSSVAIVSGGIGTVGFTDNSGLIFAYSRQPYSVYWWVSTASVGGMSKYSVPEDGVAIIKVLKDY
jgi:hypothetical protein